MLRTPNTATVKQKIAEKRLYIIAILSVAGLILANQYIVQCLIRDIKVDAHVASLASKQSMLSQRVVLLAYQTTRDSAYLSELKKEAEMWNRVHYGLQYGDDELGIPVEMALTMTNMFSKINPVQERLYKPIMSAQSGSDLEEAMDKISETGKAYLPLMGTIEERLEMGSDKVQDLVVIEIILAIVSLIVLWLEFMFIFRPIIKELKLRGKRLRVLNEAKDRILATVAHDIRGPLTAIQGTLEIVKYHTPNLTKETKDMLEMSLMSCAKTERLTKELLDISLLENDSFRLQRETTDLTEYFSGILAQFERLASEKNIAIELDVRSSHLEANIDKYNFSRVIENLVTNALKFTHEAGKVELASYEEDDYIMIEVKDTGIGIPDKLKGYIFDKFSKARRLGTRGESTTGLGMSIVKMIVEKHFGKIWLESQEGVGTSFYISLPKA